MTAPGFSILALCALCTMPASAATLAQKARDIGCLSRPIATAGMYRCRTATGDAFFNVPGVIAPRKRGSPK